MIFTETNLLDWPSTLMWLVEFVVSKPSIFRFFFFFYFRLAETHVHKKCRWRFIQNILIYLRIICDTKLTDNVRLTNNTYIARLPNWLLSEHSKNEKCPNCMQRLKLIYVTFPFPLLTHLGLLIIWCAFFFLYVLQFHVYYRYLYNIIFTPNNLEKRRRRKTSVCQ